MTSQGKLQKIHQDCKTTCTDGHYYIDSGQQHLKGRMNGHFGRVQNEISHNKPANTFATYCVDKLKTKEGSYRVRAGDARNLIKSVEIL